MFLFVGFYLYLFTYFCLRLSASFTSHLFGPRPTFHCVASVAFACFRLFHFSFCVFVCPNIFSIFCGFLRCFRSLHCSSFWFGTFHARMSFGRLRDDVWLPSTSYGSWAMDCSASCPQWPLAKQHKSLPTGSSPTIEDHRQVRRKISFDRCDGQVNFIVMKRGKGFSFTILRQEGHSVETPGWDFPTWGQAVRLYNGFFLGGRMDQSTNPRWFVR